MSVGRTVFLVLVLVAASGATTLSSGTQTQDESIVIFSPTEVYFAGQDVEVSGAAATGIDAVALYVRERGDWELLDLNEDGVLDDEDTLSVDENGTWERGNVILSNASGVLTLPGFYRIGAIDTVDATDQNGTLLETMTTDQFISSTSTQRVISVREPILEGAFQSINGQVATEDGIVSVQGIARGMDEVLVVMVDSRGRIATEQLSISGVYDVFDDDVTLETVEGRNLSEGLIIGIVIGLGRDRVAGDGTLPGSDSADITALEAYINDIDSHLSPQQILERIYQETTEERGSDDLNLFRTFQYTNGLASIETVTSATAPNDEGINQVEVGETMLIRGLTNRKPDDNTIRVEVIDGPSAERMNVASTDEWGLDGTWTVEIEAARVEPGLYTIRTEVGDQTTDIDKVRIVEPGTGDGAPDPEPTTVVTSDDDFEPTTEPVGPETTERDATETETEATESS